MAWHLSLQFDTAPSALRIARKFVAAAALAEGVSEVEALSIEVAVGEALTNAHTHAYGGRIGPLEMEIEFDELDLTVTIHDDGETITEQPAIPESLPASGSGRGLYLIRKLTDHVEIGRSASKRRGVMILMRKRLR